VLAEAGHALRLNEHIGEIGATFESVHVSKKFANAFPCGGILLMINGGKPSATPAWRS
jgi:hypothetical protein